LQQAAVENELSNARQPKMPAILTSRWYKKNLSMMSSLSGHIDLQLWGGSWR